MTLDGIKIGKNLLLASFSFKMNKKMVEKVIFVPMKLAR